jgi:hypothetical protein
MLERLKARKAIYEEEIASLESQIAERKLYLRVVDDMIEDELKNQPVVEETAEVVDEVVETVVDEVVEKQTDESY